MENSDLERISAAEDLKEMMRTSGWKKYAKPILDDMIKSVVGGQDGERWLSGECLNTNKTGMTLENLMAYKQALIEYNEQLYSIVDDGESVKAELGA